MTQRNASKNSVVYSEIVSRKIVLNAIREYAEMHITCEPGDCADCDVLRHIVELATGRLHRNIGG